jgi:hypothetical protein
VNYFVIIFTGCEVILRICTKIVGTTSKSLLEYFKLDSITSAEANRCVPSNPSSAFLIKMDLHGLIHARDAHAILDVEAAAKSDERLGDLSARVEIAATDQPFYDIMIRQRLESSVVTILQQCKYSNDRDQKDQERHDWLRKCTLNYSPKPNISSD